jgi:hypothetical protein
MEDVMNALVTNVMVGYGGRIEITAVEVARRLHAGKAARVAMAMAAPVVGLVFVVAFPLVGLAVLAWMGARRAARFARPAGRYLANIGLFLAAPFIGLAYAFAFPFVGIGLLVCRAGRRTPENRHEAA